MLITDNTPGDWRALQDEVAAILRECGFDVDIERTFDTVRSSVEIDVYGEEEIDGRTYTIACECKHWTRNVPQGIVHSFRTVLSDLGVNSGYIISSNGFQSGAFEACENTNLELLTWQEFQSEFIETWLEEFLSPILQDELDPILSYTEPLVPTWFTQVPDHEVQTLRELRERYMPFGMLIMTFMPYADFMREDGFPELPLRQHMAENIEMIPDPILDAVGYREFMNHAIEYGTQAIEEFREVRRRNEV
ncbi:restriction endonuclease [Halalkalibaculum sp. DA3122]|uniref:restriction endonuclease n=1 Tax=Halalkalibaculum sp. DA3122 TaxID=3373607 RepID=UPI0037544D2E